MSFWQGILIPQRPRSLRSLRRRRTFSFPYNLQSTNTEVGLSTDDHDDEDQNHDLDFEINLLNAFILYYNERGFYPFVSRASTLDFCKKSFSMSCTDFCSTMYPKLRKEYKKRMQRLWKMLEPLGNPREIEAIELGIRIWGIARGDELEDEDETLRFSTEEKNDDIFEVGSDFSADCAGALTMPPPAVSPGRVTGDSGDCKKIPVEELEDLLKRIDIVRNQVVDFLNPNRY